jgi:hypothetical protein
MKVIHQNDELSPTQVKAITALCTAATIGAAATTAGVGERTLYRWLAEDKAFKAGYRQARAAMFQQAHAVLVASAGEAATTLRELLSLTDRPDIRHAAAKSILVTVQKGEEQDGLLARIEELEEHQRATGAKRRA